MYSHCVVCLPHHMHTVHDTHIATNVAPVRVFCAKMAELIEMLFWGLTRVGPRNHVFDGVEIPHRKW